MRKTALLGRLIGLEVPAELVPEGEDPERLREWFFSALRFGIEAWASQGPLVFAFEDIHWADDGMLDAIEHLARWVRAPLLLVCLARDELLDRRPDWGGGRRSATQVLLDPLSPGDTQSLVATLLPEGEPCRPPWWSARAETRCSPRRWRAGSARRAACTKPSCPTPCRRCSRPASTRSSPSSGAWCSRRRWWAERSGRAHSPPWPSPRAATWRRCCSRSRTSTSSPPAPRAGWPASASWPSSTC